MNSPRCVPLDVPRNITLSPSAIISSISVCERKGGAQKCESSQGIFDPGRLSGCTGMIDHVWEDKRIDRIEVALVEDFLNEPADDGLFSSVDICMVSFHGDGGFVIGTIATPAPN